MREPKKEGPEVRKKKQSSVPTVEMCEGLRPE